MAVALVAGSMIVADALKETAGQIGTAGDAIAELQLAGAGKPSDAPARRGRPSPAKEYDVEVGKAPVRGGKAAPVTIVEWSDFQCPFCNRAGPTLARIEKEYGDKVRLAFKHLPLSIHPQAQGAHAASEAAHRQGRFWDMHDKIFANQRDLAPATFERYAKELGLDVDRFKRDVASASVRKQIDSDLKQAQELGVSGTPSFFIKRSVSLGRTAL